MSERNVDVWHRLVKDRDLAGLDRVLADDAVFHSPIVHTPQVGKALTKLYLSAAFNVLMNGDFHYVREVASEADAVLEFETELDGVRINGVDMIRWNRDGQIVDFKVMLRPLKAIQLMHRMMGEMLERLKG